MHEFFEKMVNGLDPPSPNLHFITETFERRTFDTFVPIPPRTLQLTSAVGGCGGRGGLGTGGDGRGTATEQFMQMSARHLLTVTKLSTSQWEH